MTRTAVSCCAISIAGFLFAFQYCAPLEASSATVWAGLTACFIGLVLVLTTRRRRAGVTVIGAGLAASAAALCWPAPGLRAGASNSRLDALLPAYHFVERHTMRVRAEPARVRAVMKEVTFGELAVYDTLMWLRSFGARRPRTGAENNTRMLDAVTRPGTGFLFLEESAWEWDGGMTGRPWGGAATRPVRNAEEFAAFGEPRAVKVAFNLKVSDPGGGVAEISTETRILATDDDARRIMSRYWRLVYPGSGLIRRMWLRAVRERAERPH